MPTKSVYVKPALFMKSRGVSIFHAYEDGEVDSPCHYLFSTTLDGADDHSSGGQFDVRDLPEYNSVSPPPFLIGKDNTPENKAKWDKWHGGEECRHFKMVIRKAIIAGIIKN